MYISQNISQSIQYVNFKHQKRFVQKTDRNLIKQHNMKFVNNILVIFIK